MVLALAGAVRDRLREVLLRAEADVLEAGKGSRAARAVVLAVVLRQPACGVPRLSE
jgi:hypothetical protein